MTELDVRTETDPTMVELADPTGGRLVAWAQAMHAAHQLGQALSQTAFVPQHFRGKPDECAAAVMFGDEIGLSPGQALQSIYVVSGRPGLYARSMVALVLNAGHEIWTEASSPQRVIVCGRRRGSTHTERSEWTQAKAQQAGYTSNPKYKTNPEAMLYARASSDVARRIAPDALAGLAYSVEELQLDDGADGTVTTTSRPTRKRTVQRAPLRTPDEPPLEDEPASDEPSQTDAGEHTPEETSGAEGEAGSTPAGTGSPASPTNDEPTTPSAAQMRKMHATFNDLGVTDRDRRLAITSTAIGRRIGSASELTAAEAHVLLDRLNNVTELDEEDQKIVLAEMSEPTISNKTAN